MLTPTPDELKHTVGKALGRIPSGVFVLTARHDGAASAMMSSWVQQASFDPPTVTVALSKYRPIRDLIAGAGQFAVAVVGAADTSLMKRYARGVEPGRDPFEGVETITTPAGEVVPAAALAWLECRVVQIIEFGGDHELLIARVGGGAVLRDGPSFTHLRKNGFHY